MQTKKQKQEKALRKLEEQEQEELTKLAQMGYWTSRRLVMIQTQVHNLEVKGIKTQWTSRGFFLSFTDENPIQ